VEAIIFMGCQGVGKSTFFRERFFRTHVRVNLDMLKTRHRERLLIEACLEIKQKFVVDNTNATVDDRRRYMNLVAGSGFRVIGYFFEATLAELLQRNAARLGEERIPDIAVRGTFKKLVPPVQAEGFDELFRVTVSGDGSFQVVGY
jgi:predicted kinase